VYGPHLASSHRDIAIAYAGTLACQPRPHGVRACSQELETLLANITTMPLGSLSGFPLCGWRCSPARARFSHCASASPNWPMIPAGSCPQDPATRVGRKVSPGRPYRLQICGDAKAELTRRENVSRCDRDLGRGKATATIVMCRCYIKIGDILMSQNDREGA